MRRAEVARSELYQDIENVETDIDGSVIILLFDGSRQVAGIGEFEVRLGCFDMVDDRQHDLCELCRTPLGECADLRRGSAASLVRRTPDSPGSEPL